MEVVSKHIGIVACSAEGAALCYQTICREAQVMLGEHNHPEITMHSIPMAKYLVHIWKDNWQGVAKLMLESARKLEQSGAAFAICPDNTCHQAFKFLLQKSPIPWLHIAEAVADEADRNKFRRLGILGTRYLMDGPVYPQALEAYGITSVTPDAEDRESVDKIIFKELVNGIFSEESRVAFNHIMEKLKRVGCDAIVLGCTEIPLVVQPDNTPLPTLDSTRLLARAALRKSLRF